MNLDEAQKSKVTGWIAEGLKLSDIQKRISSELGLNLTYMDVRLLVDDLKLTPKDAERAKSPDLGTAPSLPAPKTPAGQEPPAIDAPSQPPGALGSVSVKVDEIARPGMVVSGQVTFSDGNRADWYLDQMGRLGLMPQKQGYRPSQEDVATFQAELQTQLARMGF
jgi:hypothetical protein